MISIVVFVTFLQLISAQEMDYSPYYNNDDETSMGFSADLNPYVRSKLLGEACFQPTSISVKWKLNFTIEENEWEAQPPQMNIYDGNNIQDYDICSSPQDPLVSFVLNSNYCHKPYMYRKKRSVRTSRSKRSWRSSTGNWRDSTGNWGASTGNWKKRNYMKNVYKQNSTYNHYYRTTNGPYGYNNRKVNISCSGTIDISFQESTKLFAFIKRCDKSTYEFYHGCFEMKKSSIQENCEGSRVIENNGVAIKPANVFMTVAFLITGFILQYA